MTSSLANVVPPEDSETKKPGACRAFRWGDGRTICPCLSQPSIRRADVRRLQTLGARGDVEADALAFLQRLEPLLLDCGEVGEEILAAVFGSDESEALGVVEPLDCTCCHVLM